MGIDLTGVTSENEFYTHHYLAAILEGDLKPLYEAWSQQERPPWEGLRALARPFQAIQRETDPAERQALRRKWFCDLFSVLGYSITPEVIELEDGALLPLAGQIARANGQPDLWVLASLGDDGNGAALTGENEEDPLAAQEEILTRQVFAAPEPPRWVLLYGARQLLLLDRLKWPSKRFLRFDLAEILGRREPSTLRATVALLHRDSVCPPDQISLLDRLDENSHKHAFAVSEDLKYSAREAVELLGNEAVWYLREVLKEGVYGKDLAEQLTRECLRYLYRLLFLFYVEAREELGYAPMKSEEYRTGYSLESLRGAAEMDLSTEEDRNGFFLHHSLQALFRLIHDGWRHELNPQLLGDYNFRMEPLRCDLFDPARTPLLNRVRLRNYVLQEVIELLSLSREERGRRRGRISYSQLGINQLGAVYEGLLSYSGFFVETEGGFYEVQQKPKKEKKESEDDGNGDDESDPDEPARHGRVSRRQQPKSFDPLKPAYFVTAKELDAYEDAERVCDDRSRLVHHPRGKFIYRLRGRDRQKSASYYTPEVLTKCVVKYALKELLQDKTADQVLLLNICEPAIGSGAFLNEAVNQVADAYLERKQHEASRVIRHEDYLLEKQKVKAYFADNRVFGVDSNPVAIELAEVSLWLNTIYEGHTIPWFGGQLAAGNSLIGARRQVFTKEQLENQNREWLGSVPERVPLASPRARGQIWHFLVPDQGMADYSDKAVKEMLSTEIKQIRDWRKEFTKRFSATDTRALNRLSAAVDRLWQKHTEDLKQARRDTAHVFPIFGQESNATFVERGQRLTTNQRGEIFERAINPRGGQASPYQRLKLAMDYWCALWFWPLDRTNLLPTRDEFLLELSAILEGTSQEVTPLFGAEQQPLFPSGRPEQEQLRIAEELGSVNLEDLSVRLPRIANVRSIASRHRFLHWELEFADVFRENGGFDLILGNPPWIKIEWNEGDVMADFEPLYILRKFSGPRLKELRESTFQKHADLREAYLLEYVECDGTQKYLNSFQNYPILSGSQSNTFKCFIAMAIANTVPSGTFGYIHDDGLFTDPKGQALRRELYPRLRYWFQFGNDLPIFPALSGRYNTWFEVSICASKRWPVEFYAFTDVLHPVTIDSSLEHVGSGVVEGRKTDDGTWNLSGHKSRALIIDESILSLFGTLSGSVSAKPEESPLMSVYSVELVHGLEKVAAQRRTLRTLLESDFTGARMWDEAGGVLNGFIRADPAFPAEPKDLVMSGSHYSVSNPFTKSARRVCTEKSHFDVVDLSAIDRGYLPRSKYVPNCDPDRYRSVIQVTTWDSSSRVTDHYRFISRAMLNSSSERTLAGCIIPKGIGHIHTSFSVAFRDERNLLDFSAVSLSVVGDFLMKTMRVPFANISVFSRIPLLSEVAQSRDLLHSRVLLLNCLSAHYEELWRRCWRSEYMNQRWSKSDPRLRDVHFASLGPEWSWDTPLRSDYERRQALVEVDVLVARSFELTLAELCTLYRIQFPTLRQAENDTWYDQRGRTVFTWSKSLPGVGLSRPEWEKIRLMTSGTVPRKLMDDTVPGGPRERVIEYVAPFSRCNREADYATAWKFFDEAGQ